MFRIGIVGTGAIGKEIARAIDSGIVPAKLEAIWDRDEEEAKSFAATLKSKPKVLPLKELVEESNFVVEAASQAAVKEVGIAALGAGRSVMIMSVGALADKELLERLRSLAKNCHCSIYVPSGAVCGLDGVKSASIARIDTVTITTRKPREGLRGAPFIVKNNIDIDKITEPTTIYTGPASVAIKEFPANVNVAASLSLVGIGFDRTIVNVVVDPTIKRNIHEIEVKGEFGELKTHVENVPSGFNPKTSYLAALSAIATLKQVCEPLKIGT
ncbi:aspartate dehydrogenase [Methanocella sp. CWC-04]|uniref:L-aspartate dehydrogenase n=1 Tax=Methanooceanicella nereidis TaxID=2052831 RepID=A0AAP2RG74_9EURY|nr:aspartate dehydrogenase [Methanocella sp. CWC-04]